MTVTSSNSSPSDAANPVGVRMRPDLEIRKQTYQGRNYRVIKDPLALKYYRFEEEEFCILEMLDGRRSLEDVIGEFDAAFAPQRIAGAELQNLIGMFFRSGLVVSTAAGQGRQLAERRKTTARRQLWAACANILCVRFKGIYPGRLLASLERPFGWFFSIQALALTSLLVLAALLLVTAQFEQFQARLPAFHQFFAVRNWFWLALTLAGTKVLHELGHGLACRRFGGECHELGFMFLVFTPCLYCNVSDAWMIGNKWKRAAIGAAGMYVELALASVCTFVWWYSSPGFLNSICLNIMFVGSVSTILFNANPLMRFDGYYILSDLTEIPNLRQKATTILQRKLGKWVLGISEVYDPFLPQRHQLFLAIYGVAAAAYRWIITLSILWFLHQVFEPYGLQVVGQLFIAMSLYGLVIHPIWRLARFLSVPGRMQKVKKGRAIAVVAGLVAAVGILSTIPVPYYVVCGVHIEPRDASTVYVDSPGTLARIHVQPGDVVDANQPLAQLRDTGIDLAIDRLDGQRRNLLRQQQNLTRRALENDADPSAAAELSSVRESIEVVREQLKNRLADYQRLTIAAPRRGTVFSAVPLAKSARPGILPTWSGSPLQTRNVGAFVTEGVPICRIGSPDQLTAVLTIDQQAIDQIHEGLDAKMVFYQWPGKIFRGKIHRVSAMDLKVAPRELSAKNGGEVPTITDAMGNERPISTTYQASVHLDWPAGDIVIGARGRAKVRAGSRTIAYRVWRFVCQTFNM